MLPHAGLPPPHLTLPHDAYSVNTSLPFRPPSRSHSRNGHSASQWAMDNLTSRPPGDTRTQLFVGNLPFRVRWQDLKDLFRKCGTVLRSEVALTLDNRSKGFGTVLYANEMDAVKAIEVYHGYTWQTRVLDVRLDQQDPTGAITMANAAAQQAQLQAQQQQQQAMQNMANMIGFSSLALPGGQMLHQRLQPHLNQHQMNGSSPYDLQTNSPWPSGPSAAHGPSLSYLQQSGSRRGSGALAEDVARMRIGTPPGKSPSPSNVGRPSQLHPQQGSIIDSNLLYQHTTLPPSRPTSAGPTATASSIGSTLSPSRSLRTAATSISPPTTGDSAGAPSSISPTTARRQPPGSLGTMPPSIFAGLAPSAHLPHPPVAAAAALAAGYALDDVPESGNTSYDTQRRSSIQHDSVANLRSDSHHAGNTHLVAPVPVPGGLMNFYQQNNASSGALSSHSAGSGPNHGTPHHFPQQVPFRSTPSPAFANRHLFVGNIPFNCQWQDLKDLFRNAGQILRADVSLGPDGRSRGFGTVLFATHEDAVNAVKLFNGYELQGRHLKVHFDRYASPNMAAQTLGAGHQGSSPAAHMHHQSHMHPSPFGNGAGQAGHYGHLHHLQTQSPYRYVEDSPSVPGTPIHESILGGYEAFPSPGFASPIVQQIPRSMNNTRPVLAPIGSGAPIHSNAPPLSPLTIPGRGQSMMSSGGVFSPSAAGAGPMSPHSGLPLLTPSMPGFSFHAYPQTPPLMPQFLSPGLGPFSPPLQGIHAGFFGPYGPSALRDPIPQTQDDRETTPLQSPRSEAATEHGMTNLSERSTLDGHSLASDEGVPLAITSIARQNDQALNDSPHLSVDERGDESADVAGLTRRASTDGIKATGHLAVEADSSARGVSFDIVRPTIESLGGTVISSPSMRKADVQQKTSAEEGSPVTKKSPWHLPWLKSK